jgi:hypothetical protein
VGVAPRAIATTICPAGLKALGVGNTRFGSTGVEAVAWLVVTSAPPTAILAAVTIDKPIAAVR